MFNIIVVADDHDNIIGSNCQRSYSYLSSQIDVTSYNMHLLTGEACQAANVQEAISSFQKQKFILVAYSHGQSHALVSTYATDGYVTLGMAPHFKTSLVYTNSCLTGLELMRALVSNDCHGYVGYTGLVRLPAREEDEMVFITCENKGLINFLTTDDTLTQSIEVMKKFYAEKVKEFARKKMYVTAGRLQRNLNHLVHYDYNAIKRGDFITDLQATS
ncbi:hypothetical protein [uncultured Hymenobacter sp.]|uniref:hypothetical protein n=1 Tax=uncultured Hymenobacter sp. TaxID=170016 RepID=UPI0035CC0369